MMSTPALRVARLACRVVPLPGGMEQHIWRVSQEMARHGVRTSLLYESGDPPTDSDVHCVRAASPTDLRSQPAREIRFGIACERWLAKQPAGDQPNVIHTHGGWALSVIGRRLARRTGARHFHSVHGDVALNPLRRLTWRWAGRGETRLCTVSAPLADKLGDLSRHEPIVRSSGFDPDIFFPAARALDDGEPWRLVTVGRIHPMKGHDVLLQALAKCREQGLEIELTLIGSGPEEASIRELASRLGLRVRFTGSLPPQEIAAQLRGSHLFALSSRPHAGSGEGTPTAAIEALACGLPIVGTDTGGMARLLEESSAGLLVPPEDADALATALRTALGNRDLRLAQRARALEISRQNTWASVAHRLKTAYENCSSDAASATASR